jgi:hypothetical protein
VRAIATLFVAVVAGAAAAQPGPFVAEVITDVTLRSGPGETMPDTGHLSRGTRLVVDHDEGDWLAVHPPGGQVSWINHKFLAPKDDQPGDVTPRNAVVHAEPDAEVAVGRPGLNKPLDVRKTRVPDGTVVCVIGAKAEANGSMWYPIAPPDGDFRYVPRSAVRAVRGSSGPSFVVRSPTPPPVVPAAATTENPPLASLPTPAGAASGRADNWPNNPVWRQAEQADRAGDFARAEELYLRLAGDMNRPGGDAELANLCYNRVHAVREKQRGGRPTTAAAVRQDLPPGGAGITRASEGAWTRPGRLREAGFRFDRQLAYALVDDDNKVICYAVPSSRADLSRYVGRDLELYGETEYPGDLRRGVVTVTSVRAAR